MSDCSSPPCLNLILWCAGIEGLRDLQLFGVLHLQHKINVQAVVLCHHDHQASEIERIATDYNLCIAFEDDKLRLTPDLGLRLGYNHVIKHQLHFEPSAGVFDCQSLDTNDSDRLRPVLDAVGDD